MTEENPSARCADAVRAALSDIHQARADLTEAHRLAEKYDLGEESSIESAMRALESASRDLEGPVQRYSYSGGGSCFPAFARVATPTGPRPITYLRVGDLVLSCGSSATNPVPTRVPATHAHSPHRVLRIDFTDGTSLCATPNRRVRAQRGWVRVDRLRVGDACARPMAEAAGRVLRVAPDGVAPVYSLYTAYTHAYIVDGILVHDFSRIPTLRTLWHRLAQYRRRECQKAHAHTWTTSECIASGSSS